LASALLPVAGMEDKDDPPRPGPLAAESAPAQRSPEARHEDALSPARVLRDRASESRSDRIGNNTPTGPATSPPAPDER
jgi:hypothetical protein